MLADMQEAGIPVTFGYIADVHERKDWSFQCTTADATAFGNALGPGDACYEENLQRYDQAFAKFLDRLAKDGIGPNNTLFVIGAEENDHFAGANVGRADAPSDPANCDGVTTPCRYAHNQVGEVQANIVGSSCGEANTTPFDLEPQGASIYVHNPDAAAASPPASDPAGASWNAAPPGSPANNPHSGDQRRDDHELPGRGDRATHPAPGDRRPAAHADGHLVPEARLLLRRRVADLRRAPEPCGRLRHRQPRFAWNHGYYSPDIDITWSSFAGPGVGARGVDGPQPGRQPRGRGLPTAGGWSPTSAHTARGPTRPTSARRCFFVGASPTTT